MRYGKGARKKLKHRGFDSEEIELILDRLETAVPHLHFDAWNVGKRTAVSPPYSPGDTYVGQVSWGDNTLTYIKVALEVENDTRISSTCSRYAGAVSKSDYEFVLNLAREAAGIVTTSLEADVSLFEFGTQAVASEIESRAKLESDPTPILRFVRSLAQETYENQRLSYGIIFSDLQSGDAPFAQAFDNQRVKRLTDGFSTAVILDGRCRIAGYAAFEAPENEGLRTSRRPWSTAGLAELSYKLDGVGLSLTRSGDILVLHNNRLQFSLRAGKWRVWNHAEILSKLRSEWTVKGPSIHIDSVLRYLYHVALDLSLRRSGALLVVLGRDSRLGDLLMSNSDRVGAPRREAMEETLDNLMQSSAVQRIDKRLIADIAALDGALVVNRRGHVLAYGAMTRSARTGAQGARSRAAIAASREGIAIKVSSDGVISMYANGRCFMEI